VRVNVDEADRYPGAKGVPEPTPCQQHRETYSQFLRGNPPLGARYLAARFADPERGNFIVSMLAVLEESQVAERAPLHVHIVEIVRIQRTGRIRQCMEDFHGADRETALQSCRKRQLLAWRDARSRIQICQHGLAGASKHSGFRPCDPQRAIEAHSHG
jgi:hypothetical protein